MLSKIHIALLLATAGLSAHEMMSDQEVETMLKKYIAQLKLPEKIGKDQTLFSAKVTGHGITFNYILDFTKEQLKSSGYIRNFSKVTKNFYRVAYCTAPSMKIFKDNDISLHEDFYTKDHKIVARITVNPKDCDVASCKKSCEEN